MSTEDARLARPIFTWRETARYVGVPKSTIREFGSRPAGRTQDAEALFDYAERRRDGDVRELVVVRAGQRQFSEPVRDYLRCITYGDDGWATQVRVSTYRRAHVVVDLHVAFGLPIVTPAGAARRRPRGPVYRGRHHWRYRRRLPSPSRAGGGHHPHRDASFVLNESTE